MVVVGRRIRGIAREGVGGLFKDRVKPTPDLIMFLMMSCLMALGALMVYSATHVRLEADTGDPSSAMRRQLVFAGVAVGVFVVGSLIDYRQYRRLLAPIYLTSLALLGGVLFADRRQGASRWIPVGDFQFQPSEFAKVSLIIVLAGLLVRKAQPRLEWSRLALVLAAVAVPCFLVFLQPDLGTMLVIGAILVGILFVAGTSLRQILVLLAGGAAGVWIVLQRELLAEYQLERLRGFTNQSRDLLGSNYNLDQSLIAIGAGQIQGQGLFNGNQTSLNFVPSQTTDFIFTAVGEQFGFIGGAAVLIVYSVLVSRILMVAAGAPDRFGTLIAVGMASMLSFHVFINIGMTIGIVPVTGLPLPFMSAGGSAMIAMAGGLGVVNSIWRSRTPLGEHLRERERSPG